MKNLFKTFLLAGIFLFSLNYGAQAQELSIVETVPSSYNNRDYVVHYCNINLGIPAGADGSYVQVHYTDYVTYEDGTIREYEGIDTICLETGVYEVGYYYCEGDCYYDPVYGYGSVRRTIHYLSGSY